MDKVAVYIVVSPSNEENAADHKPDIIAGEAIPAIVSWVTDGGVLAIFANGGDCDIDHLNDLARQFGAVFHDPPSDNIPKPAGIVTFEGNQIDAYAETILYMSRGVSQQHNMPRIPVFRGAEDVYVKNFSGIDANKSDVQELLTVYHLAEFKKPYKKISWFHRYIGWILEGDTGKGIIGTTTDSATVLASTQFGRGSVIFVGCPWFENRSLDYASPKLNNDNRVVAVNFVQWLLGVAGGH